MTTTSPGPAAGVGPLSSTSPRSLPARFMGILFSPRAAYAAVAARPAWLGMLALVTLLGMSGTAALLSTQVGQEPWLDAAVQQREAYGQRVTDEQYQRLEQMMPYAGAIGAGFQLVVVPLSALVISGLAFAIFSAF